MEKKKSFLKLVSTYINRWHNTDYRAICYTQMSTKMSNFGYTENKFNLIKSKISINRFTITY
jgi:hypothetical protein